MQTNALSICTVLYESGDVLDEFIKSLAPHLGSQDEILFLDNSSTNGIEGRISELDASVPCTVRYWFRGENIGFARACNFLAREAAGQRLVFLNPDTRTIQLDCNKHQKSEIVGARIFDSMGRDEGTYGVRRGLRDEILLRWFRRKGKRPSGSGYVSGAALSVDRDVFVSHGGFDERFFMYYEDIDLCLALATKACVIRQSDEWQVVHQGGSAAQKIRATSEIRSFDSACAFYDKWNNHPTLFVWWSLVDSMIRIPIWLALREKSNCRAQIGLSRHIWRRLRANKAKGAY